MPVSFADDVVHHVRMRNVTSALAGVGVFRKNLIRWRPWQPGPAKLDLKWAEIDAFELNGVGRDRESSAPEVKIERRELLF
jgi:hypothetical protein